jgi:hypothetical protein
MEDNMDDLATHQAVICTAHGLHLSLAAKLRMEAGADDEDVAIASTLAALDNATILAHGDKDCGIAWLRAALMLIEAGQPLVVETDYD